MQNSRGKFCFWSLLGLIALGGVGPAQAAGSCFEKTSGGWKSSVDAQASRYERISGKKFLSAEKTPQFLRAAKSAGNEKLAILIHGFMGSPGEFADFPQSLVAAGYDVALPTVENYGGSDAMLGTMNEQEQLARLEAQLLPLMECYSEVTLMGFSNGGSLSTILTQRHPKQIDSLVLVEPAVRLKLSGVLFACVSSTALMTKTLDVTNVGSWAERGDMRDFQPVVECPSVYSRVINLDEAKNVLRASDQSFEDLRLLPRDLPILVVYSEAAQSVDAPALLQGLKSVGQTRVSTLRMKPGLRLRHQIFLEEFAQKAALYGTLVRYAEKKSLQ